MLTRTVIAWLTVIGFGALKWVLKGLYKGRRSGQRMQVKSTEQKHSAGERVTELCVLKWLTWGDDVKQHEGPNLEGVFKTSRMPL
jgi:hypothetical protein